MISYLIGINDFYKLIGIDSKRITRIIPFNMYGTLNKPAKNNNPDQEVQILELPTRIVELDFKKNSSTTFLGTNPSSSHTNTLALAPRAPDDDVENARIDEPFENLIPPLA